MSSHESTEHETNGEPQSLNTAKLPRVDVAIVDDSITIRKIVEVCLGREGITVKGFADGIELLEWVHRQNKDVPSVFLLDVVLPKMNGYAIAQHLRRRPETKDCFMMFLTRRDGLFDRLKGRFVGGSAHLSKPFQTSELINAVWEALKQSRSREDQKD